MVRSGRTVMPGVSMSTKNAVMASWLGVSASPVRVSRTHRVRVLGEAGPHLLAVDDPLIAAFCTARVVSDARSLPEPGSEKPWHHVSSPRQQPRHHLGGQFGRRVVDHRRASAPRASSTGPGRSSPRPTISSPTIGAQDRRTAEPARRLRPAVAHPAGVVQRPQHAGDAAPGARRASGPRRRCQVVLVEPGSQRRAERRRVRTGQSSALRAFRSRAGDRSRGRRCAG